MELRTAEQWAAHDGIRIVDPDGWRTEDAPAWDALISYEDYQYRMIRSSIMSLPGH